MSAEYEIERLSDTAHLANVRVLDGRTVAERVRPDGTAESIVLLSEDEAAEMAGLSVNERRERCAHLYAEGGAR